MNKKIISIAVGIVIILGGIGIYYGLSNYGYINPGIKINSFTSSSNSYENNSSANIPVFYAHVDSSKTSEYELIINGNPVIHGVVTGSENITLPSTLSQYALISACLAPPGLHTLTFKVLYNSFSTSKTMQIYTFPSESFTESHEYIDVGISDQIKASNNIDNISINGHSGPVYNFIPSSAGIYNISYSMSYKNFHFSGIAKEIYVYNMPVPTGISYNNYSYCSLDNTSCFTIYMNETGGDILAYVHHGYIDLTLNYSIYINGTYYTTVSNSGYYNFSSSSYMYSRDISYPVALNGQGPFYIYYIIGDRYYNDSASKTIEVP